MEWCGSKEQEEFFPNCDSLNVKLHGSISLINANTKPCQKLFTFFKSLGAMCTHSSTYFSSVKLSFYF